MFVDLIQRHEQAFYHFVHKVHSKGEGLFSSLMQWIELFLTLMREGLGDPISLEFLLPHKGPERDAIMQEIDSVARYHYKLKLAYEAKVRRRFGRTQGKGDADAEDEEAAQLVNSVVEDLSFGDLVKGDADDLAAEQTDSDETDSSSEEDSDSDSDDSDDSSDEYETGSDQGSEESASGTSTEGGHRTPGNKREEREATPIARSATIGHSPWHPQPPAGPPTPSKSPSVIRSHQSMDLSSGSRSPVSPGGAGAMLQRSMTLDSAKGKALPPLPPSQSEGSSSTAPRSRERSRPRPSSDSPAQKSKKPEGPKPPVLQHVPKLLPLFVEMVSPVFFGGADKEPRF